MNPYRKLPVIFLTTILLQVCLPALVSAQFTETKDFTRKFRVNPSTRIEIINKYGNVEILSWDKDSVVVDIHVRVEEKKLSRLENVMDQIDFEFTEGRQLLIIRTKTEDNLSALEKEFMRFKESLIQPGGKTEINMELKLPKANELRVENKFGDIYMSDYDGEADLVLSNGNLNARNFSGKLNLSLNFADASINEIIHGRFDCNYSDITLRKAESLNATSKSSTIEIQEIGYLDTDSRRDKYRINNINKMDARGSFTSFRIEELTDRLSLRSEYGNMEVNRIMPGFSNVYTDSRSTDMNLRFPSGTDFDFEIMYTKSDVWITKEVIIKNEEILNENEGRKKISGTFGKKSSGNKKLIISAISGEINILSD